jgi:PadR family transcriptional regulator PadR
MSKNYQKEIRVKLAKGLLDLIVLQLLEREPMHGYQLMSKIRRDFGVCFGASTVYPLLTDLERKGYVESNWSTNNDRPRKIYNLTVEGESILNVTENSLVLICKTMNKNHPELVY